MSSKRNKSRYLPGCESRYNDILNDDEYDFVSGKYKPDELAHARAYNPVSQTGFVPGTAAIPYKRCSHDGQSKPIIIGNVRVTGATGSCLDMFAGLNIVIDAGGSVSMTKRPFIKSGPANITKLELPGLQPCPVVRLDWPDRQAPPVPASWWTSLLKTLDASYSRVVCACIGGHGRTGTMLAALLLAGCNELTPEDAVALVKEIHCDKAVEASSQFRYLATLRPEWTPTKAYKQNMEETSQWYNRELATG